MAGPHDSESPCRILFGVRLRKFVGLVPAGGFARFLVRGNGRVNNCLFSVRGPSLTLFAGLVPLGVARRNLSVSLDRGSTSNVGTCLMASEIVGRAHNIVIYCGVSLINLVANVPAIGLLSGIFADFFQGSGHVPDFSSIVVRTAHKPCRETSFLPSRPVCMKGVGAALFRQSAKFCEWRRSYVKLGTKNYTWTTARIFATTVAMVRKA